MYNSNSHTCSQTAAEDTTLSPLMLGMHRTRIGNGDGSDYQEFFGNGPEACLMRPETQQHLCRQANAECHKPDTHDMTSMTSKVPSRC